MIKRRAGDVDPREYNWKEQFDIDPKDVDFAPFIEMDLGKVRGLAIYAEELEMKLNAMSDIVWER